MRQEIEGHRRAWRRGAATMRAAALLAAIVLGASGCSGDADPAAAPSGATPTWVAPRAVVPSVNAPTPTPTAADEAHLARSTPTRVQIPAIGVDSELMELGVRDDGTMQVPAGGFPAGWYTGSPTPGELGPAIIAGHVDWDGPGVFYELRNTSPDDEVTVLRADGSAALFRVTRVEQYPKDQFPTQLVYGDIDHAGLRLITCGGSFNRQSGHYDDNVVVFAELVRPASP